MNPRMARPLSLAGHRIGEGHPCFVIAEAGVNHNGDLRRALRMVDVAARAGADAVKFQTFIAEELVVPGTGKAAYQNRRTGAKGDQAAMLKRLELSEADHRALQARCRRRNIVFLSTAFESRSLDLLKRLGVPAYKISSTDLTNLPFINEVSRLGRPVILSTGMSRLTEVTAAVRVLRRRLGRRFVLLQCTSNYPTQPEHVNLRAMHTLRDTFGCLVGFSDHTEGVGASPAAVAAGACVIEKHFTLDKRLPGPDHAASLNPEELADLVREIRRVEAYLGDSRKQPLPSEKPVRALMQKSIVAARDLQPGVRLRAGDLCCKRPAGGVSPAELPYFLGRILRHALKQDQRLRKDDVGA